jgi:hypothetical protein
MKDYLGKGDSYITEFLKAAKAGGFLNDDRTGWVQKIRNAWNDAIHGYSEFESKWLGDRTPNLRHVIENTRYILMDLYRLPRG